MECARGRLQHIAQRALDAATGRPIVIAPGQALGAVSWAVTETETPVRLVTRADGLDAASWSVRGRLADAVDGASEIRTNPVDGVVFAGGGVATTVDATTTPPTAWIDTDPDEELIAPYREVWESGTPQTVTAPRAAAVRDAVATVGGESAVADLRAVTQPTRSQSDPEAVATAVWAAAGVTPRRRELTDAVADRLDCSRRTVERRISELYEHDVLGRVYEDDDDAGRPEALVVRRVERPLARPVRAVLCGE